MNSEMNSDADAREGLFIYASYSAYSFASGHFLISDLINASCSFVGGLSFEGTFFTFSTPSRVPYTKEDYLF